METRFLCPTCSEAGTPWIVHTRRAVGIHAGPGLQEVLQYQKTGSTLPSWQQPVRDQPLILLGHLRPGRPSASVSQEGARREEASLYSGPAPGNSVASGSEINDI